MHLKVKYCEVNNESYLHIADGTYNPRKLQKRGQNMQNQLLPHLSRSRNI
jgi:hypothetical protein